MTGNCHQPQLGVDTRCVEHEARTGHPILSQTPITVHLINTGNEQLATGNSIRRRHERRKSRFNFIHGVKIPTRRFCTIGVYLEKSNLAQKHLVAVLS